MKRIISISIALIVTTLAYAQSPLQKFVNDPALKHASVGVMVKDLNTGKTIDSHNGDKSLTTASIMKLVTTAAALELFGPDYRYKTTIVLDKENTNKILVLGSGDPTLGSEAFDNQSRDFLSVWANNLTSRLAAKNSWKLYVVDDLFGYAGVSPEWTWIDMGNYYASGAYGISVFDNTYRLYFDTTNKNGRPTIIKTVPEIVGLKFTNYMTLNTNGSDNGYIYGAPFSYERSVRGNIPAGRKEFSIKGDIPDPGMTLGIELSKVLKSKGINIVSVNTAQEDYIAQLDQKFATPPYSIGEIIYEHRSQPMSDIIREVNVQSNNHYTEHLIRTIGRKINPNIYSDALQEGIDYVYRFLKARNIRTEALFLHDGCGLAPQDAASPNFFCDLLSYMYVKSNNSKTYFESLPKAGEPESTLQNFMDGTKYEGKIAAKSGSIGGVQCFAGYLVDGDKKYAFTIMVNKFNGTRTQVRSAIEKYLESL